MTLNYDGSINYRGYVLMVSTIQVHIWRGAEFVDTAHGEPGLALQRAKVLIDTWVDGAV